MTKKIGVYAGSFDPFTSGHLSVLRNAAKLFDEVIVAIANNSTKKARRIDAETMKDLIEQVIIDESITNAKVEICKGVLSRFAESRNASFIVRGLRNVSDFQAEEILAEINGRITSEIKTVYFRAEHGYISSSMVMDLYGYGEDVSEYLPEVINKFILDSDY